MAETLKARIAQNIKLKCAVHDCQKRRNGLFHFCTTHLVSYKIYGHPLGRVIRLHEFKEEAAEIADLLRLNPDHAGLKLVKDWFLSRKRMASAGSTFPFYEAFLLLEEARPLEETLARIGGLYLLRQKDEIQRLFRTEAAFFANIAGAVINYLPYKQNGLKKPPRQKHRLLGELINRELGVFFMTLAKAAESRKKAARSRLEELASPWVIVEPRVVKVKPKKIGPKGGYRIKKYNGGQHAVRVYPDPATGEVMTLGELAKKYGMIYSTLRNRLRYGWPLERAVSEPVFNCGKRKL